MKTVTICIIVITLLAGFWTGIYWQRREAGIVAAVNINTNKVGQIVKSLNIQASNIGQLSQRIGVLERIEERIDQLGKENEKKRR